MPPPPGRNALSRSAIFRSASQVSTLVVMSSAGFMVNVTIYARRAAGSAAASIFVDSARCIIGRLDMFPAFRRQSTDW